MGQAIPIPIATPPRHNPSAPRHPGQSAVPPAPSPAPALTPEHHAQIARAQQQRKKINRAVKVAAFNAWSFAVFAAFSLLLALFSISSLIAGIALAGLAYNEFRGRRQMQQLDLRAPQSLGVNQVVCCILVALYCGIKIYSAMSGPGLYAQSIEQSPELGPMLEPMQELMTTVTISAYALLLVVALALQGTTACYYFSRKRSLADYLQQTPGWVLDLDRARL